MIVIIDYNAGNLISVKRALDHLGADSVISSNPDDLFNADKIIFPGVGNASSAMKVLKSENLDKAITDCFKLGKPILGICLGTQIILEYSEEDSTDCLAIIPGKTVRFKLDNPSLKIPHMGWNSINIIKNHPVLKGIKNRDEFYFVHSYYPSPSDDNLIQTYSGHGVDFPSCIGYKNIIATQFHPEKSGHAGLNILNNFLEWDGRHA